MRTYLFPSKDTTIYRDRPDQNVGVDQILEIAKVGPFLQPTRVLMQFDLTSVSEGLSNGTIRPDAQFFLNLKYANGKTILQNSEIQIYPLSQSWTEGTGKALEDVQNASDGASWLYRIGYPEFLRWDSSASLNLAGGGTYYTASVVSKSIVDIQTTDFRADVTPIVHQWLSGSIPNTGFMLKFPTDVENSIYFDTAVQIFSKDTHTIYKPTLEIAWTNETFQTGTLAPINPSDFLVRPINLNETYYLGDSIKVRFAVREQYPLKTFDNVFRYRNSQYLPSGSQYSIVDVTTAQSVIPADRYSPVSCDSTGSYVEFNTSNFYINRYYKIVLKIPTTGGTKLISEDMQFRIGQV